MKRVFHIQDQTLINEMLCSSRYGTLALYGSDKTNPKNAALPYAVPVNFVYHDQAIFFHSSPKGKKMRLLAANPKASFNVVAEENIIPSYFSSTEGLACPATSFFKSITIDGTTDIISERETIAEVFETMMQRLQPEGKYRSFSDADYDLEFKALVMVKITVHTLTAKFKFGQQLTEERFQMIRQHLLARKQEEDARTIARMQQLRPVKKPSS